MASQGTQSSGQESQMARLAAQGPPYAPLNAQVGLIPTPSIDDPISAVLILLFLIGAVANMTIFQINRRRSHKFVMSAMFFGFSVSRIVAISLRMALASHPENVRLFIASSIFTNAGVVLLFVVNIIFAQRILRAYHPRIGWSKPAKIFFRALFVSIGANLAMVIAVIIYTFYTLDASIRSKLIIVQRTGITYMAFLAFLPIPITIITLLLPRSAPMDKFGKGRMRTKIRLLLFTASLLSLGAGFRAGTAFYVRPKSDPMWFHYRASFYLFNFTVEIIVTYIYMLSRFDRRFHVPNGSSEPGHYSQANHELSDEALPRRINTEEEVFGESERLPTDEELSVKEREWEENLKKEVHRETV